jgi:Family of unknown function (DUF5681)
VARKPFSPGQSGNPAGRPAGARNRLQGAFLSDLAADWEMHGAEAIRVMRIERPADYVRCVASLMPRELQIESVLHEVSDEELEAAIEHVRRQLQQSAINAVATDITEPKLISKASKNE